jgi:uncharacterized protein YraI
MKRIILPVILAMGLILSACGPSATPTPPPTQDVAAIETEAAASVYADLTAAAPTATPPPPGETPDPNLPVAVVPTPASGQPAGVASYNTAIMSGPGEAYVLYAALLGGASVEVLGISEDSLWWVISVPPAPNGQGWVSAAFLATTGAESVPVVTTPPVPPTTEMVPPGPDDPQATALANVYVRNGPGTNYPAYGIAPVNSTGRVVGVSEDRAWWVVRIDPTKVGAGYGWVMAQYTTATNTEDVPVIANPPTQEAVSPPPPAAGVPAAMAVDYVNVRTGPGTNYPVLGVAAPGAYGEVSGKSADGAWWQVKVPTTLIASGLAWVSASYVVTENTDGVPVVEGPPAPPPVESTPPAPPATVSCQLVSQDPLDGTTISIGAPFTTTWVLQNTGGADWSKSSYDVSFIGAYNNVWLHTGPDLFDLAATVPPGGNYNFSVDMLAPTYTGTYGEAWQIANENGEVACQFWVYITVP